MKIVLLEPLGISADKLKTLGDAMTAQGHEFVSYDTLAKDEAEQIKRIDGADVVIIANHPLPGAVIDSDPNLKMISVAFVGIDHAASTTWTSKPASAAASAFPTPAATATTPSPNWRSA